MLYYFDLVTRYDIQLSNRCCLLLPFVMYYMWNVNHSKDGACQLYDQHYVMANSMLYYQHNQHVTINISTILSSSRTILCTSRTSQHTTFIHTNTTYISTYTTNTAYTSTTWWRSKWSDR